MIFLSTSFFLDRMACLVFEQLPGLETAGSLLIHLQYDLLRTILVTIAPSDELKMHLSDEIIKVTLSLCRLSPHFC